MHIRPEDGLLIHREFIQMSVNETMVREILKQLHKIESVKPEDFPALELYMDQVTTFIGSKLSSCRRYPDDKILTKTMINNYAKNRLLPAPVKKKYSRNHILMLILIYYFKNVVSFSEIETFFSPLSEKHFAEGSVPELSELYREIFALEEDQRESLKKDVMEKFAIAEKTFPDAPEEDREFLRLYAFVCELAFDVYIKKEMIELIADELRAEQSNPRKR
jgi:hypothetical protein